jgi:6-phosphofructokinase 2
MAGIVTITFSPCIDRYSTVPQLIPDSKLKCSDPVLHPGGGGINVARVVKKLGGDVTAIYTAGGYTGAYFNRLLSVEDIPAIVVETTSETRENFIILDEQSNKQYRFGMPGNELKKKEWSHMLSALENMADVGYIVASGSLPPGVPEDIFARIAGIAREKAAKLILDTSGEPLKLALEEGVFLIKPNLRELSFLAGNRPLTGDDIWKQGQLLIDQHKAQVVVVSMGEKGAWLIKKDSIQLITPPPAVKRSTVGAGDSMVAGIAWMLSQDSSLKEAAEYGVACGTAATIKEGTELCSKEDADRFYQQIGYHKAEIIIRSSTGTHYPV